MNNSVAISTGVPSGRRYGLMLGVFAALLLIAGVWLGVMLTTAPDSVPWGFFVANYIYLLGITQFGVVFAAILRICRTKWARPFYRLGELMTLAFFPFAIGIFVLIFCYGRSELFWWLSPEPGEHLSAWLNADFLLIRNLIAQLVFYVLAAIYFVIGLVPDITADSAATGPAWRQSLYRRLFKFGQGRDPRRLQSYMYLLAPVIIITAVLANTFISWDFGMMLVRHYHSSVFPMYFAMGSMVAGSAAMLVMGAMMSRVLDFGAYFGTVQVKSLGIMITGLVLFWVYMFWAQFFVTWFGNLPNEFGPLWAQMYGHYAPLFWAQMICIIGIPIGTLIFAPVKRTWWAMVLIGTVINVGVWINRYLIVVPALDDNAVPFSSLFEFILFLGLISGFMLVLLWLMNVFPMISSWEMRDAEDSNPVY